MVLNKSLLPYRYVESPFPFRSHLAPSPHSAAQTSFYKEADSSDFIFGYLRLGPQHLRRLSNRWSYDYCMTMGDAARPSDDKFSQNLEESPKTWSSYIDTQSDGLLPRLTIDLRPLASHIPPLLGGTLPA